MADVFISYSKQERALTERIAALVAAASYSVWWDTSLLPGDSFKDIIPDEIRKSKAAIVIWTPASVRSEWVYSEATRARAQRKLIPVRTGNVGLHDIPPPFDAFHTELIDGTDAILAAVTKLAGAGSVPPPAKSPANGQTRTRAALPRRDYSDADDLNTKMLRSVEYMQFHAKYGEGTIRIHASNHEHSNEPKKPHKRGTPADEEWSDDIFLAVVEPAWTELLSLLCLFGGWRQEDVILGRCAGDYPHLGKHFRRAVDTGSGVGHADWGMFSALLHIRNWQNFRDIDDGYVDLYFTADKDPHGWDSSPLENDPKVKQVLESVLPRVKESVERIARLILQDDSVTLRARPPVWEEDMMPVDGGDAYHFRFVVV